MRKRRALIRAAVFVLLMLLILPGFYTGLTVRRYRVDLPGITGPIRIVQVSDLHACRYGTAGEELIAAIEAEKPDIIALTGDIFDDKLPPDDAVAVLEGIAGKYPCWYVTGNHEYWSSPEAFRKAMETLEGLGIRRLAGEMELVSVRGETVAVCGVDDPDGHFMAGENPAGSWVDFGGQVGQVQELARDYKGAVVLLAHRPESMPLYVYHGFDLVLAGHAHGGQWRIPGVLNGLYAPHQGVLPEYAGGIYREGGTVMVVSRGLARETTRVPRFYNPPELVVIELV